MSNLFIRKEISRNNLRYWEVAEQIGISNGQFSVWLRTQLSEERKQRVLTAIHQLTDKQAV